MKQTRLVAVVSAVLCGCGTMAFADDLAEIEKEIVAAWAKVKSYSAKTTSTTTYAYNGRTQKTESQGTTEMVLKGEQAFSRTDMNQTTVTTEDGKTTTEKTHLLMVGDAEFMWTLNETEEKTTVTKMEAHKAAMYSPKSYFKTYRDNYTMKSLPDAKFDGADCYVFEARQKPTEGVPASGPYVTYYRKDCGISVKTLIYDADGKVTMESLTTDLKLNPSISDKRFEFTVPEGVEVMDMTPEGQKKQREQMEADQAADQQKREQKRQEKAEADNKKQAEKDEAGKKKQAEKDEQAKKKDPAKKPEVNKKKKKKLKLPKIKFP